MSLLQHTAQERFLFSRGERGEIFKEDHNNARN